MGSNTGAVTDIQVSRDAGLPTELNTVPDLTAPRDTGLSNDYAPFSDSHVVPDLYQIINPRARTDDCVRPGATVNSRIGTNFDLILDQNTAKLRYCHRAGR